MMRTLVVIFFIIVLGAFHLSRLGEGQRLKKAKGEAGRGSCSGRDYSWGRGEE